MGYYEDLELVKKDYRNILSVEDPSDERLQMAAIHENIEAITLLKNLSESVKERVSSLLEDRVASPKVYAYLSDDDFPFTDIAMYMAVKADGGLIKFFKNPSNSVMLASVRDVGSNIKYIVNPPEIVQTEAVSHNQGFNISYIKNPCHQAKYLAVEDSPYNLYYIEDIDEPLLKLGVDQDNRIVFRNEFKDVYNRLKEPSYFINKYLVEINPMFIEYIKNPDEEIQLLALNLSADVRKNPFQYHIADDVYSEFMESSKKVKAEQFKSANLDEDFEVGSRQKVSLGMKKPALGGLLGGKDEGVTELTESQVKLMSSILSNMVKFLKSRGITGSVSLYEEHDLLHITDKFRKSYVIDKKGNTYYTGDVPHTLKDLKTAKSYIEKTVKLVEKNIPFPVKYITFTVEDKDFIGGNITKSINEEGSFDIKLW